MPLGLSAVHMSHGEHSVGAIERSRKEKGEPTITYEAFVNEFDAGDSFTATLVDVLVKVHA